MGNRSYVVLVLDNGVQIASASRDELWSHFDRKGSNVMLDVDEAIRTYVSDTTEQDNGNEHASEGSADAGQAD